MKLGDAEKFLERMRPKPITVLKRPPEPIIIEDEVPSPSPKGIKQWLIDLAQSSEFERLIYLIWKGQTHRGKGANLRRVLAYEHKKRFGPVLMELKEVLKKRKEVI